MLFPQHRRNTGSWNLSSSKTGTYLFYVDNVMSPYAQATQRNRTPATMIFTMLNRINSVPARSGSPLQYRVVITKYSPKYSQKSLLTHLSGRDTERQLWILRVLYVLLKSRKCCIVLYIANEPLIMRMYLQWVPRVCMALLCIVLLMNGRSMIVWRWTD